jgi:2-isopropylmalate synthase
MPHHKYRPHRPHLDGHTRRWVDREPAAAPRWCSVDLRDGNQALAEPMDTRRKLVLYRTLVDIGFDEIEVGFPAASSTDAAFVRELIDGGHIGDGVAIGALTQCRADLIDATFAALAGAPSAIVHFYNSTSPLQRDVTFGTDIAGVTRLAVDGARMCRDAQAHHDATGVTYEYSPESFTATEPDVAADIVAAVHDALELDDGETLIVNLPATVEHYPAHIYGDVVEHLCDLLAARGLRAGTDIVISVHPHNDRGTAVAATEAALRAGAQRVEGTLFGNGERTGNVDLVTVALNLMVDGIDPRLDLSDLDSVRQVAEWATGIDVHPRHPYAGDLVHTAFSGSHQDAIAKGLARIDTDYDTWEVPYLPVDPAHLGRDYTAVIRVNSQSGKGGAAYVLADRAGYELPRGLAAEFSKVVQTHTDTHGGELDPAALVALFDSTYGIDGSAAITCTSHHIDSVSDTTRIDAQLNVDGEPVELRGRGIGTVAAYLTGLNAVLGTELDVDAYHTHALDSGDRASAVSYIALRSATGEQRWGVGVHPNTTSADLAAINSAAAALRS